MKFVEYKLFNVTKSRESKNKQKFQFFPQIIHILKKSAFTQTNIHTFIFTQEVETTFFFLSSFFVRVYSVSVF